MTKALKYTDEQLCTIITKAVNALPLANDAKSIAVSYLYEIAFDHTCTTDFNIKLEAFMHKVFANA